MVSPENIHTVWVSCIHVRNKKKAMNLKESKGRSHLRGLGERKGYYNLEKIKEKKFLPKCNNNKTSTHKNTGKCWFPAAISRQTLTIWKTVLFKNFRLLFMCMSVCVHTAPREARGGCCNCSTGLQEVWAAHLETQNWILLLREQQVLLSAQPLLQRLNFTGLIEK